MTEPKREKLKVKILEELAKTPIVEAACRNVGLSRATFYRWVSETEEFEDAVNVAQAQGRERVNDMAESVVINGIKEENQKYVFFWLQHNHRNYIKRKKVTAPFKRMFSRWSNTENDY